jgi:hypothetical protein
MIETMVVRVRAEENFMMNVEIVLKYELSRFEVVLVPCMR